MTGQKRPGGSDGGKRRAGARPASGGSRRPGGDLRRIRRPGGGSPSARPGSDAAPGGYSKFNRPPRREGPAKPSSKPGNRTARGSGFRRKAAPGPRGADRGVSPAAPAAGPRAEGDQARALAQQVIARADRDHPADRMVRMVLREQEEVPAGVRRETSRAVFAYYRWLKWLHHPQPLSERIKQAVQIQARFQERPASVAIGEIREQALPPWALTQVEASPGWLVALQREPRVWLRAKQGQAAALAAKLGHCRLFGQGRLAEAIEYRGSEDLFHRPEYLAGEFELQDLSSQAVGHICDPKPGETWWDACAGEGGKTLLLSDLMAGRGLIWATDRAEWRLQWLRKRAARAKVFNLRVAPWNGGVHRPVKTAFDGVLVDAPCAGLGTWTRNPHARWTTTLNDVQELAARQVELLNHVAPGVKPGGRLVYAVCSLTRAETTSVAAAFQSKHPEFKPEAVAHPLSTQPKSASQLWFWPQEHGGNGMFVAVWKRVAVNAQAPKPTEPKKAGAK